MFVDHTHALTSAGWAVQPASGLPVHFFSIFVGNDAIKRSYLGGLPGLQESFPDARNGAGLVRLSDISWRDLEHALEQLETDGLLRGRDFALADMMHGELLPCRGISFFDVSTGDMPSWIAYAAVGGGA